MMRKMNVLVLCLVCSWVLTAGFFSPSPGKHSSKDDKERVVIGVDQRDDGNTKVSVSPDEVEVDGKGLVGSAKDKIESFVGRRKQELEEGVGEGIGKAKERVKDAATEAEMKETMKKGVIIPLMSVVHLVGLAVAYGMSVWITFASNYVLGTQQMAMVQSRMYPLYFKAMAVSVGMALLGHVMHNQDRLSVLSLVASLAMILVNLLYLEPRAAKVMSERMKKEKEEGSGTGAEKEGEKARKSRALMSLLNLATLIFLTSHLLHLAYRLHALS